MKRFLFISCLFICCSISSFSQAFGIMSYDSEGDAHELGITVIRNAVNLSTGNGLRQMQPGYDYITNVIYKSATSGSKAIPTPAQLPGAKQKLIDLLIAAPAKPAMLAVENEENFNEANGTVANIIAETKMVRDVAAQFHTNYTNGGITMPAVKGLAYDYYISKHTAADSLSAKIFKYSKCSSGQLAFLKSYLAALNKDSLLTVFNFHYQFTNASDSTGYRLAIEALFVLMPNRYLMNNELAQRDTSPATTTTMINVSRRLIYTVLYAMTGQQGQAKPFSAAMMTAAKDAIYQDSDTEPVYYRTSSF